MVAVYYDQRFYVGEVIEVTSPNLATVRFLEILSLKKNIFRWPAVEDIGRVESKFVFAHGLGISTKNGRIWAVDNASEVVNRYEMYKKHFC